MKLFNRITLPPARGNLVTPKYLLRCFQAVLGKFNMTVEGAEVQQTGDGHLHMRVTATGGDADCTYPFKVAMSADGYMTMTSGDVVMEGRSPVTPLMGGLSLASSSPPRLFIGQFTGRKFVYLKMIYVPVFGFFQYTQSAAYLVYYLSGCTLFEPPVIEVRNEGAANVMPVMDWAVGATVTPGERWLRIADLVGNGQSITVEQSWFGHCYTILENNGNLLTNIGG